MTDSHEDEIRQLMQIAARIGEEAALTQWLRAHPHAPVLPWILSGSSNGRPRICYPSERPGERRGRRKKA